MDPTKNPFAPGAGTQPPELTGRAEDINRARIVLDRVKLSKSDRSMLFIGLRGVGKTVLLNRLQKIAQDKGYYTVLIESPEEKKLSALLTPYLRQILLRIDLIKGRKEKLRKAVAALRSFASTFKVDIGDIGIGVTPSPGVADSGSLEQDLTDLLVSIGEAAQESKSGVAIFIDEMQYLGNAELAALLTGIHRVGQLNLPLVVFGAGLPQLTGLTGKAKSYAERLFEFRKIGPLKKEDSVKAIKEPVGREGVTIDSRALDKLIQETEGYPYFLQEWGLHSWNCARGSKIKLKDVVLATDEAVERLDQSFFRVRFDRLTKGEKEYLRAMAELGRGPHRSGDIASKLSKGVDQVAPIRAHIIAKGMIYSPSYGDNAFTVPKFDEYMRRVMPFKK